MDEELETDYLVVGAGAAAMAFTDALLAHSDATVTMVDRRHTPGGHWVDAYPYVRLHQPSAFYGVSSVPLGQDALDVAGTNAGYYELAGADEIRAYFAHVMHRRFLPSGRVRYFPNSEYLGDDRFVSRLAQASWNVRVRRKLVDTTYLEGAIPATSAPPFEVADGVRCVPAGEIARTSERPERFVIIGAGKTALDACVWLLEQGVPTAAIRWIKSKGLPRPPLRPIFEPGRVTVQPFLWGFACYQFAMLGVVEATVESDEEKNRLCPPIAYWDANTDYPSAFLAMLANERARAAYPALASWAKKTRLNPLGGIAQYRDAPNVIDTRERIKRFGAAAASNLVKLLRGSTAQPTASGGAG